MVTGMVHLAPVVTHVPGLSWPMSPSQALDFRTFWGEKSELRRFQDGSICEAVVWEADTVCQKRLIPEQIIRHLLKL